MAREECSQNNTPPRSPECIEVMEDDMFEVIDMDELVDDDGDDIRYNEELMSEGEEEDEEPQAPPERDDSFATLANHTYSVLACSVHPNLPHIIATGAIDNKVVIWDCSGAEAKVLLDYTPEENLESIDCVKFSPDGRFLGSCDLYGTVHLFSCENGYSHLGTFQQEEEFTAFMWHPSNKAFIVITSDQVTLHKMPSMESKIILGRTDGKFRCGKLFPDGKRLVVCDERGNVRVIDLKTQSVVTSCLVKSMENENVDVYCVDIHMDGKSIICGCYKGLIANVNAETGKVSYFPGPYEALLDVEVIECGNKPALKNYVTSGHRNGHIRFWDLSRSALRCENKTDIPVTSMKWHPHTPHVFTGHADGKIRMSDVRDGSVVRDYLGHYPMILSIEISFDGNFLVSTSDDCTAKVYVINDEKPQPQPQLQLEPS